MVVLVYLISEIIFVCDEGFDVFIEVIVIVVDSVGLIVF